MSDRVIFFNGFVGHTANNRIRLIQERVAAAVERFMDREGQSDEKRIRKVIIVGEESQENFSDARLMKHLSAAGIPVDQMELAGNAWNTFRAIELFVIKASELYPDQHIRVYVATHEWLLDRTIFYMRRWHKPGASTLAVKVRECCPKGGYQPTWWERLRESFRRGDAVYASAWQDNPEAWQNLQLIHDIGRLTI